MSTVDVAGDRPVLCHLELELGLTLPNPSGIEDGHPPPVDHTMDERFDNVERSVLAKLSRYVKLPGRPVLDDPTPNTVVGAIWSPPPSLGIGRHVGILPRPATEIDEAA